MARIAGVDLPKNKRGEIGLTYIFGIGPSTAKYILGKAEIDVNKKVHQWNDEELTEQFKKAGADILTVHIEACPHLHRNIEQIKSLGMQAGVAINPHTPVYMLKDILQDIDVVCMMSVNAGFGGQSFIPHTLEKIRELRKMIDEQQLSVKIEIDGGVTVGNAQLIVDSGADVLVAGNTVFGSIMPKEVIARLKQVTKSHE